MEELVARQRASGASPDVARALVAASLNVVRDVVDERVQIAERARRDPQAAERLSQLRGRMRGRHEAPLGMAAYRVLLRLEPRELRHAVIDALETDGNSSHSFREIVDKIALIRRSSASLDAGSPRRASDADDIRSDARPKHWSDIDPPVSLRECAPRMTATLERLGSDGQLPVSQWWAILSADLRDLDKRVQAVLARAERAIGRRNPG
jgi:hypothetical protein